MKSIQTTSGDVVASFTMMTQTILLLAFGLSGITETPSERAAVISAKLHFERQIKSIKKNPTTARKYL
jgi:hypothetical protein